MTNVYWNCQMALMEVVFWLRKVAFFQSSFEEDPKVWNNGWLGDCSYDKLDEYNKAKFDFFSKFTASKITDRKLIGITICNGEKLLKLIKSNHERKSSPHGSS